jgi:RND family efflux transporter MFP subunit
LRDKFFKWIAPFIILMTGIGIMALMIANRAVPKKEERIMHGIPVYTLKVEKKNYEAIVAGTGIVQAAQEITIIPQVSGRVLSVSPSFVSGGFFKKGDLLFEVDDIDYRLALEQAKARLANAEYELSVAESRARVARLEWQRIEAGREESPNPLVLHEPQIKNAQAALASAQAVVKQAQLDLERTKFYAPFNCLVRLESVEIGQYLRTGTVVGSLIGTDTAEIVVPLPIEEISWLNIPKQAYGGIGSKAIIKLNVGEKILEWQGNIIRSIREVDPKSRMLSVVVGVKDPYGIASAKPAASLPVGAFVEGLFIGNTITNAVSIPPAAIRENSTVWIADADNMLRIAEVKVIRMEKQRVLISEGVNSGDSIVLTTITGAADGMKLRPLEQEKQ